MTPQDIRVALCQVSIHWEEPEKNREMLSSWVSEVHHKADLLVFPEAITTGFGGKAYDLVEEEFGKTYELLDRLSQKYQVGIICSFFVQEKDGSKKNRFYLFDGNSSKVSYQDKRHLFALGGEKEAFSPARERKVLNFRGWRILPTICYDLRFPVWTRNVGLEYDILITVANWPEARRSVWTTLLKARAMENLCYSIGCNRVGKDGLGLRYSGDSSIFSPKGELLSICPRGQESCAIGLIQYKPMAHLRKAFPVWEDADTFTIEL